MDTPEVKVAVRHRIGHIDLATEFSSSAKFIAIEGPSGAGKSTFLRIIAGTTRAETGTVCFRNKIWQDQGVFVPAWERGTAWVPQDALLFPHLNVRGNLAFAGEHPELAAVASTLEIDSLLTRWPRHLSGGERQRVALGRAMLTGSKLLLLDEPFAALDRTLRKRVRTCVRQWAEKTNATVVLVSHHTSDAEAWDAESWVFENGRISRL